MWRAAATDICRGGPLPTAPRLPVARVAAGRGSPAARAVNWDHPDTRMAAVPLATFARAAAGRGGPLPTAPRLPVARVAAERGAPAARALIGGHPDTQVEFPLNVATAVPLGDLTSSHTDTCVACFDSPATVCSIRCGHVCFCLVCHHSNVRARPGTPKCPVCNTVSPVILVTHPVRMCVVCPK